MAWNDSPASERKQGSLCKYIEGPIDNDLAEFTNGRTLVVGSLDCVGPLSEAIGPPTDVVSENQPPDALRKTGVPIISIGKDKETASPVAQVMSELREDNQPTGWSFTTETRFNKSGLERKTTSDFGFIGWIIAQLNEN